MADEQNSGGIIERLRNSPRTVSTIIVILIIAGAIFAFSDRGTKPAPEPTAEATKEGEHPEETTPTVEATAAPASTPAEEEEKTVTKETPLPEPAETAEAYVEVAARGNGVTHLARRATARYLETNAPNFTVTNEHRIFIEDFLKDYTDRAALGVSDTRTFSKSHLREAVEASKGLSDAQLKHLQKYSMRVRWQ